MNDMKNIKKLIKNIEKIIKKKIIKNSKNGK